MSAAGRKEKIQEFVVRDSGHCQWRMVNAGIGKHLQVKRNYYEAPNQVQKKNTLYKKEFYVQLMKALITKQTHNKMKHFCRNYRQGNKTLINANP